MLEKQLIVVVETTAAMGPYWQTILSDYLDKIIRSLGGNDTTGQKPSTSNVEFALVTFSTRGCYSGIVAQRTGWTSDPDTFWKWLSALSFVGGGFDDAAIAEGLSEAIMMFPTCQNGSRSQQNVNLQKHCILVAASNPDPVPTQVYVPRLQNLDQGETIESDTGNRLHDAEAVAKAFPQCSVSLSVICPKQLPKVKVIYNAGKRNSCAAGPLVDIKNSNFLVLISESFREACSALSRSGITTLPSNQSPVKVDAGPVAPVTVVSSGTGITIPTPRTSQQAQQGMQLLVVNNAAANMPLQQQTSGALQSTQSKYVKVWEGSLSGQRQGQPVFITTLVGYRSFSASELLASDWRHTMRIDRLISQDHMNNQQYVGKADFLVFRALNPHGFLAQLQEKKLCAVIQLPSQTLLLSVSSNACCLIGMLFPVDTVVINPRLSSQQQQ
ncbi:mediator of RNA polymerase II transcription subunit 25-like isoform X2 [Prosopis cineraria]|uniref:mediator of RNA polymerase II transcription subunit 25-like isoform X2 n=1 Tax=Prosopis cineraria TaxID=364024 RepID=UPI00240F037C|nr:mediator of RNA polymerase II transcription subunit 25-like isoform X2 [Prosopis cineraria]